MRIELKREVEAFPRFEGIGCRAWRWVLGTGVSVAWLSFGLTEEVIFLDESNGKWGPGARYFYVAVDGKWKWGQEHFWYDGPHCTWHFGFLHFYWSWNHCKKCLSEV